MASTPAKTEFRKVRDFGETLNVSFAFFRQNFKSLMLGLLFIAGPFMLVGSVIPAITLSRMSAINTPGYDPFLQIGTSIGINVLSLMVGFVMLTAVMYEYILLYEQSEEERPVITFNDLWGAVRRDFFRIMLGMIGLIVVVGGGMALAIAGIAAVLFPLGGVMIFFGMMAIFIGAIYFMPPLTMVFFPVYLFERANFFDSLSRSFGLVKGFWWQTFGLFIICFFISASLSQLLLMPISIFTVSSAMLNPYEATSSVSSLTLVLVVTSVLATIAYTFTSSLQMIVSAFQYFSLVERRESTGLLEKIQTMGTEAPTQKDDFYAEEEEHY